LWRGGRAKTPGAPLLYSSNIRLGQGSLERWDDAIRDDLAIHELAVHKQGPLSFFAIATLSDAALAQCRAPLKKDEEPFQKRAFESLKAALDRPPSQN